MIGILIDACQRRVSTVEYTYRSIGQIIGIGTRPFALAGRLDTGDAVVVDDEGMLREFRAGFRLVGMREDDQPLAGNGLVFGRDNADDTDPPLITVERLTGLIEWVDEGEYRRWIADRWHTPATVVTRADGTSEVLATWGQIYRDAHPTHPDPRTMP